MEAYAIDQYLMKGGSVILAVSPYMLDADYMSGSLTLTPIISGLEGMLNSYGVDVQPLLVMDTQNAPFPVAVNRKVGQFQVQEIQAVPYPFFLDVRPDKMDPENLVVSGLPTVSMNWSSPVQIISDQPQPYTTTVLMSSSDQSWTSASTNIQPDFALYPETGFAVGESKSSYPLAVSLVGTFNSFFREKPVPVQTNPDGSQTEPSSLTTIQQSSAESRLIVFGSSGFLDDFPLQLSSRLSQDYVVNNLRLLQNAVDWAVEDTDLLSIRSRGAATRVLIPLNKKQQTFWEVGIYVIEIILLAGLVIYWQVKRRKNQAVSILIEKDQVVDTGGDHE
jgi:ABC-2 type transport system permease protein